MRWLQEGVSKFPASLLELWESFFSLAKLAGVEHPAVPLPLDRVAHVKHFMVDEILKQIARDRR